MARSGISITWLVRPWCSRPASWLDPSSPDVNGLCAWLEGALYTTEKITPTPQEIRTRLGADSPGHAVDILDLTSLYEAHRDLPTVHLKRQRGYSGVPRTLKGAAVGGFSDAVLCRR